MTQPVIDAGHLLCDVLRYHLGRGGKPVGHVSRGAAEAARNVRAVLADEGRGRSTGVGHGIGDVAALEAERIGDMEACVGDARRQPLGDGIEVARQGLVSTRYGAPHPVCVRDDRFPLVDELVDHRAHPALVVGVGPFETGDFVAHEIFEFPRTGKGAFDAVTHGGHLAADRMREVDDLLGRYRFRLGKPHRDLGHGARGQTHVLGPAHQRRHDIEEHHRADQGPERAENRGLSEARGRDAVGEQSSRVKAVAAGQHPEKRTDRSRNERGSARARLQTLEKPAHRMAVIVGMHAGGQHRAWCRATGVGEGLDLWCGDVGRARRREWAFDGEGRCAAGTGVRRNLGRGRQGWRLLLDEVESFLDRHQGRRGRILGFVLYGHTRLTDASLRGLQVTRRRSTMSPGLNPTRHCAKR